MRVERGSTTKPYTHKTDNNDKRGGGEMMREECHASQEVEEEGWRE